MRRTAVLNFFQVNGCSVFNYLAITIHVLEGIVLWGRLRKDRQTLWPLFETKPKTYVKHYHLLLLCFCRKQLISLTNFFKEKKKYTPTNHF